MMKATIKTIAQKARVSIATVSMVLNKKDERISETTRQKILAIAAELNYQPNVIARSLVTARTKTIGLLIPDVSNPFFAEIAKSIETNLSEKNYNVFLCNSNNDKKKEKAYLAELLSRNIDGLIVSSVNAEDFIDKKTIAAARIPILVFDRYADGQDYYTISIEDKKGGALAAGEFADSGHLAIACLCGSTHYRNMRQRVEGFKETLANRSIKIDPALFIASDLTIEGGYQSAKALISPIKERRVTAVFCTNDLIAFGAYQAFKEAGLEIPGDVSVVGFDDIEFSKYLSPPLTTVGQPISAIGRQAARTILRAAKASRPEQNHVIFPVRLMRRGSVKRQSARA